ncbi:hypothetical protein [Capillibacterium thermochitinicola]|nr:hypothetical protein [Capillibacterium thermochitinicola]
MSDNIVTTLRILLQSLAVTFFGMIIIYSAIKLLVKYFPEDKEEQ